VAVRSDARFDDVRGDPARQQVVVDSKLERPAVEAGERGGERLDQQADGGIGFTGAAALWGAHGMILGCRRPSR